MNICIFDIWSNSMIQASWWIFENNWGYPSRVANTRKMIYKCWIFQASSPIPKKRLVGNTIQPLMSVKCGQTKPSLAPVAPTFLYHTPIDVKNVMTIRNHTNDLIHDTSGYVFPDVRALTKNHALMRWDHHHMMLRHPAVPPSFTPWHHDLTQRWPSHGWISGCVVFGSFDVGKNRSGTVDIGGLPGQF